MSYRLSLDLPVEDALRAVAAERLEKGAALLRDEPDPVTAVHGARKNLKKTRSLLRLARPALPAKAYRRENDRLRDVARSISGARDADVLVETLDGLAEHLVGRVPEEAVAELRARLVEAAEQSRQATHGAVSRETAGVLEAAAQRTAEWPLARADRRTLRAGSARAYARGRDALRTAEHDPTVEHLHDWRKRVKDLWYHQRLLAEAWRGPLDAFADQTDHLSELLGDDHDLAVLTEALAPADDEAFVDAIAQRRAALQAEAFALGRLVYAERTKAYARRLGAYLALRERAAATP